MKPSALHWGLLAACVAVFIWSAIEPYDRLTWWLEVAPAVIGVGLVMVLWNRFRLTDMVLVLIAIHAIILMIGGHHTYAEVPFFNWLRDEYGLARNHYDRLGHLAQGFVPAMIAREIFVRLGVFARRGWMPFVILCVALAISAFYELIEWWVALLSDEAAESFLGTQGDNWDTQWDMFCALLGASIALLMLSRWHDRQLAKI